MKVTDRDLVMGVHLYRTHPRVNGRHGPMSLKEFGHFLAHTFAHVAQPVTKASLSVRLERLVGQGLLAVCHDQPWDGDGNGDRLFTPGLFVTEQGYKFLGSQGSGDGSASSG